MSILSISQTFSQKQSLLNTGAVPKDVAFFKENAVNRDVATVRDGEDRGAGETPKEPSRADETIFAFRRIFMEKKAEKEAAAPQKSRNQEHNDPEPLLKRTELTGKKVKEAVKQAAFAKEGQKLNTLKEILSGLLDKNLKAKEPASKKDKAQIKDKNIESRSAERMMTLRERLELFRQRETDSAALRTAASKAGNEKTERQVVVVDLRDRAGEKAKTPAAATGKAAAKTAADKAEGREVRKPLAAKDSFETRFFSQNSGPLDSTDANQRTEGEPAVRFRSDFSARMADIMKNDMVKHTGLVLKNNGGGEIHLVLKPESLGSVRMKLTMEDNHIVGKIIVDNNTVKEIMEENLGNLETALHQNGYETAAFSVSVAGEQRQGPRNEEEAFAELLGADREDSAAPVKEYEAGGVSIYADSLVNILM